VTTFAADALAIATTIYSAFVAAAGPFAYVGGFLLFALALTVLVQVPARLAARA
jgi:hypothetical protein